jgi:hypothetical protein
MLKSRFWMTSTLGLALMSGGFVPAIHADDEKPTTEPKVEAPAEEAKPEADKKAESKDAEKSDKADEGKDEKSIPDEVRELDRIVKEHLRLRGGQPGMIVESLPDLPPSKFVIGVMVQPIAPEARELLPIEGEGGLVVGDVLDDGPAAKAGLKRNDVITHVGDQELTDIIQLVKAIDVAGEKSVQIRYLRKGKEQTTEVTPVLRGSVAHPAEEAAPPSNDAEAERAAEAIGRAIQRMRDKGAPHNGPMPGMRITKMGPGFISGPPATAEQIEKLTKTIEDLRMEVESLRKTVEELKAK